MMKYEITSHNFIPKKQKIARPLDVKSLDQENILLKEEKNRLIETLEDIQQQISVIEEELNNKEKELVLSKDTILSLEDNLGKYEMLKDDLNKVDSLKLEINTLNSQINRLNKENLTLNKEKLSLNEEIESYKQHVQTLYLILLILALL